MIRTSIPRAKSGCVMVLQKYRYFNVRIQGNQLVRAQMFHIYLEAPSLACPEEALPVLQDVESKP